MQNPLFPALCFVVLAGGLVAFLLEITREDDCYWRDGEIRNGQYMLYDEPVRVCEGRGSNGSGRSLRRSSSSNKSGGWFRK